MKKILALILCFPLFSLAQNSLDDANKFQTELVSFYENPETTPLNDSEKEHFQGISFFELNEKYAVNAKLEKLLNEKPFIMPATGKKQQKYKKYGILHFTINDVKLSLVIYQNLELSKIKEYSKHLFLPFYDLTSGETSYGGGRYLDILIPDNDVVLLDFNKAYNPYCAYSPRYSCPITPEENFLNIEIQAGASYSKNEI